MSWCLPPARLIVGYRPAPWLRPQTWRENRAALRLRHVALRFRVVAQRLHVAVRSGFDLRQSRRLADFRGHRLDRAQLEGRRASYRRPQSASAPQRNRMTVHLLPQQDLIAKGNCSPAPRGWLQFQPAISVVGQCPSYCVSVVGENVLLLCWRLTRPAASFG